MAFRDVSKMEMADAQLGHALKLYLYGGDPICALTLAGAAEEILGKALQAAGGKTALSTEQAATSAVIKAWQGRDISNKVIADIANRARNAVKHYDPTGPAAIHMDPEKEARDMIDRAITNYFRLVGDQTELMGEFLRREYPGV